MIPGLRRVRAPADHAASRIQPRRTWRAAELGTRVAVDRLEEILPERSDVADPERKVLPDLPLDLEAELVGQRRAEIFGNDRPRQEVGIRSGGNARRGVLQRRERVGEVVSSDRRDEWERAGDVLRDGQERVIVRARVPSAQRQTVVACQEPDDSCVARPRDPVEADPGLEVVPIGAGNRRQTKDGVVAVGGEHALVQLDQP